MAAQSNDVWHEALAKVPEVTLGFWVINTFYTTLGETGGNSVTMTWLQADAASSQWRIPDRHGHISCPVPCRRARPDSGQKVQPLDLLAGHHSLYDRGHSHGRSFRSLLGHRLCRRRVNFVGVRLVLTRDLVFHPGLDQCSNGCNAEGGTLLLGDDHVFADPRDRSRRLDGGQHRIGV